MTTITTEGPEGLVSIGVLATELGLSTDALRAWERRYGSPRTVRLPSGHRRYSREEVMRMRLVTELVRHGARISQVIGLSDDELEARLARLDAGRSPELSRILEEWLGCALRYDVRALASALALEEARVGLVSLVEDRITPFMIEIGRRWADGRLDIRHEHFASHVVQDHLQRRRAAGSADADGARRMVLATLQGESHGIGIEMAALLCEEHGIEPLIIGVDTPAEELAQAALETRADFIGVGVSVANSGPAMDHQLVRLRAAVPESIEIVVGGAGIMNRRGPRGVKICGDMCVFSKWLQERSKR